MALHLAEGMEVWLPMWSDGREKRDVVMGLCAISGFAGEKKG